MIATALLKSMRPRQWSKNVFVLAALVFSQRVTSPPHVFTSVSAFFSFCLLASGVYLINDCLDIDEDRRHPRKCHRPIAAGMLPVWMAMVAAWVLIFVSLVLALYLGLWFLACLIVYLILNLGYSTVLKHVVILDVMLIASGFVIRAVAGAVALRVPFSHWLLLCTSTLSLFLAFTKRRQELVHLGEGAAEHRRSLSHYNLSFLDQMISVSTSCTVMSYALYTVSPEVVEKFHTTGLRCTIPFVLFGIFRYLYLIHVLHVQGDPTITILSDKWSIANVFAWGVSIVAVLYTPAWP